MFLKIFTQLSWLFFKQREHLYLRGNKQFLLLSSFEQWKLFNWLFVPTVLHKKMFGVFNQLLFSAFDAYLLLCQKGQYTVDSSSLNPCCLRFCRLWSYPALTSLFQIEVMSPIFVLYSDILYLLFFKLDQTDGGTRNAYGIQYRSKTWISTHCRIQHSVFSC